MFKYYVLKTTIINGSFYNPGEIINSQTRIDNKDLKEIELPIQMGANIPTAKNDIKEEVEKEEKKEEKKLKKEYNFKGKIADIF